MKRRMKIFCKILLTLLSLMLALLLAAGVFFGIKGYRMYREAMESRPLETMVMEIQNQENFTPYEELPQRYVEAVVSAEDKRFWKHGGVDYLAICRAAWNDLRTWSFAEGGSTITQQLMKNEYFTQEKKLERKCAEVFAAWEIEERYSKEEIFELYVNTIYFGSGYYGIYDAAMGYYEKAPSELSDYEAVMLSGLPNAPSVYAPNINSDLTEQRMKQVLDRMVACKVLSPDEANALLQEE